MTGLANVQKEQKRVIEMCQFTWDMQAASEILSFERDIYSWYLQHRPECKSVYLPLFWTAIWRVVHDYPSDAVLELMERVSDIYNSLNKDIPYHTITSEVHCNKQTFPELPSNVQVYGPGYGKNDKIICHEIPLLPLTQKMYFNFKRDIFCSYFISGEYSCRKRLNEFLYGHEGSGHPGFFVSYRIPSCIYNELLSRSTFALTPRGTNISAYRIYEAIQYGAIPVYISDKFSLPYSEEVNWSMIAVLVYINDIEKIPEILRRITPERIHQMQEYGQWFFENYVQLDKMCERIFAHANQVN